MQIIRLLLVATLLQLSAVAVFADWPQWRGQRQDGSVAESSLAGANQLELNLAWRRPLGSGYSSVSIDGELAVTMATMEGRDWVLAFHPASGREHWRHDLGATHLGHSGSDDGQMSTPAIADGAIYTLTTAGRFLALDADGGDLLWDHDLDQDFAGDPDVYGYSTAPIVVGDRVYLLAGGADGQMLIAFDAESGQVLWKTGTDRVLQQNLLLTTLAGERQVVAPARSSVAGFATEDGRELWRFDFDGPTAAGGAVEIDADRVLVTRWESVHMLEIVSGAEGLEAKEVWGSNVLASSYAVPIKLGGHLYGFNRRFLSCVEVDTGEVVWKSRPPGGQGLIAAGGHLFMISNDGSLVSVRATPEGYQETGRLGLFEKRRVMTPPSFADGRLFARDLNQMAAVDVRSATASTAARSAGSTLVGEGPLMTLLRRLESEAPSERADTLAELEERFPHSPVVEGGRAHFLFRGEVPDLAVAGDMTGVHENVAMVRMAGTDLYHRSFAAPEAGRWEYQYKVFGEAQLDTLNETSIETPDGARSVVTFGTDDGSAAPPPCEECATGRVTTHGILSRQPDRSYQATVYTPAGYSVDGDDRYPVLFWAQGKNAQEFGQPVAWLDALIGRGEIEPIIVVFLELPPQAWWSRNFDRLGEIMAEDVLPFLERNYRLSPDSARRALLTQDDSVPNMLRWGLDRGVGALAVQSPFLYKFYLERTLTPRLAKDDVASGTFYVDWGTYDQYNPDWYRDVEAHSGQLAELFREAGFDVVAKETPGGANWTRYSSQIGELLRLLFPASASTGP